MSITINCMEDNDTAFTFLEFALLTFASKMFTEILSVCTRQFNICWYLHFTAYERGMVSTNAKKIGMVIDVLWTT